MSNSIFISSRSLGHNDNATRYVALTGTGGQPTTTGQVEVPIRDAGTFSNMFVYVPTNTASVSSTITLQKSQVDTALIVTYTADQTGIKEDTSNSVSFAATDEAQWEVTIPTEAGTNTLTINLIACQFAPTTTSDCIVVLGATGTTNYSSASTTRWIIPSNSPAPAGGTEASSKYRARFAFTASDLYAFVTANARTTDTTFTTRKNGAAGGQTVTYTSGQTGAKEDTSGTDSIAVGDDYNYAITTSTGTETITFTVVSTSIINTGGVFPLLSGFSAGSGVGPTVTTYFPVGGSLVTTSTTEADYQIYPRFTFTASEFGAMVLTNTNAVLSAVITVMDNGAGSAMTVTYTAAQTGLKNDSSNTAVITSGTDEIDYQVVNNDVAGTITITWLGCLGTTTAATDKTTSVTTPGVLSGIDADVFTETSGVTSPGKLSGADVNTFTETASATAPAVFSGIDANVFTKTGGVTTPGALASADNSVVFNETGGAASPGVMSGADVNTFNDTGGLTTPAVMSGADQNDFTDSGSLTTPAVLSGVDSTVYDNTGGVTTPASLASADNSVVYNETGDTKAPAVLSGTDANVYSDTGGVTTPAVVSGVDSNVYNDSAGVTTPAVISGADNFITVDTGGWVTPAVLSGTSQATQVYDKTGGITAPLVLGGVDVTLFNDTGGFSTPAVIAGFDSFVSTDTASITTPAVLSGQSSSNQVYDKTGGVTASCAMSGTDSTVYNDTASATAPAVMSGSDVTIFTDTAGAVTPAVLSGIDQWISDHTGAVTSPAVLSGTHDAGPVVGHGGSGWLPYPFEVGEIDISHGKTQREREGAVLDDDDEAMLLLF